MMLGSCLRKERSAAAKVNPICSLDLDLVDPAEVVFHRILGGHDVGFRRVQPVQRRIQGGGLAAARGPVTRTMP